MKHGFDLGEHTSASTPDQSIEWLFKSTQNLPSRLVIGWCRSEELETLLVPRYSSSIETIAQLELVKLILELVAGAGRIWHMNPLSNFIMALALHRLRHLLLLSLLMSISLYCSSDNPYFHFLWCLTDAVRTFSRFSSRYSLPLINRDSLFS